MHRFQDKSTNSRSQTFCKKESTVGATFLYFRTLSVDLFKESLRTPGEENLQYNFEDKVQTG